MKNLVLVLLAVLSASLLHAQDKKVDFHFTEDGKYCIDGADHDYYVFEYDGMTAESLRNKAIYVWGNLAHYPKSFIGEGLRLCLVDGHYFIAESRHYIYNLSSDVLFRFSFKTHFKDGKMRIDIPNLEKVTLESTGQVYYPETWATFKLGMLASKPLEDAKIWAEYAVNTRINQFLEYMMPREINWDSPIVLESPEVLLFHLAGEEGFSFSGASATDNHSINISFPGLNKNQILDFVYDQFTMITRGRKAWERYDFINADWFHNFDGIQITGTSSITPNTGLLPSTYSFQFRFFMMATDEVLKVYAPVVYQIEKYTAGKDKRLRTFYSFSKFLSFEHFTNADGTLSDKNRTQRAVDDINKVFNLLVFEPLYYTQSAWFNRKPEDTEW